jgi:lipopolysaccharide/colanic/teichoic acid biosynthesis glycosyltransferase
LRIAQRTAIKRAVSKRLFDLFWSTLGLVILSPFLAAIAIAIKLGSRGPVFYRGERVGLHGSKFRIYKFRTMVLDADKIGGSSTPEDDPRVTRAGKFLRRYKLDELPQLINVFVGEMSLVGPRPQVTWQADLYTPEEREVFKVRPGITDWASLKFSNEGEILKGSTDPDKDYFEKIHPEKMRLAIEYVRNHSLAIDVRIIFKTLAAIFK